MVELFWAVFESSAEAAFVTSVLNASFLRRAFVACRESGRDFHLHPWSKGPFRGTTGMIRPPRRAKSSSRHTHIFVPQTEERRLTLDAAGVLVLPSARKRRERSEPAQLLCAPKAGSVCAKGTARAARLYHVKHGRLGSWDEMSVCRARPSAASRASERRRENHPHERC